MRKTYIIQSLLVLGISTLVLTHHALAEDKRIVTNICYRNVVLRDQGTLTNGKQFRTYEFRVMGDQNMRARVAQVYDAENYEDGNSSFYIRSNAAGCADSSGSDLFWRSNGEVRLDGPMLVRDSLNGDFTKAEDVIFGYPKSTDISPTTSLNTHTDYDCTYVTSGDNGTRTSTAHVSCAGGAAGRPARKQFYGTINDAGGSYVNGQRLWCVGLAGFIAGRDTTGTIGTNCQGQVNNQNMGKFGNPSPPPNYPYNYFGQDIYPRMVDGYGGSWAGFLDDLRTQAAGGLPYTNSVILNQSYAVNAAGLGISNPGTGVTNFNLVLHGANTYDGRTQNDGYGKTSGGSYVCWKGGTYTGNNCQRPTEILPYVGPFAGQVITFVYPKDNKCPDGSLPPGGNMNNCPNPVGQCPNYPNSTVTYTENGTAPAGTFRSEYSGAVTVDGNTVANVTASSGTVPLSSMAPFMDANIHSVATSGAVTHTYNYIITPDNPSTPAYDPVIGTASVTNTFTVSPNPWPSANIGCFSRHFDLSDVTFPHGELLPDEEEPSSYDTDGSIHAVLTADGPVSAAYPLKVLSTPTIEVQGARPGISNSPNFAFGNRVSTTFNDIYELNNITNLRTSWPLATPLAAGQQYCAIFTIEKAVGDMDVFGYPIDGKITTPVVTKDGGCERVVDRPYMKSFNNDVRAGTIKAWTRYPGWTGAAGEGYRGSSSQFATLIMSGGLAGDLAATSDAVTKGFYSASQRSQTGPTPPCAGVGLVIANPGNAGCPSADLSAAGVMAGTMPAATKWWDLTIPIDYGSRINNTKVINTHDLVNLPDSQDDDGYAYFADGMIGGYCPAGGGRNTVGTAANPAQCFELNGTTIPDRSRVTVYVKGDVKINGNITYKNCANDCTYASKDDMPFFTVIAKGSIFIDKAVTQLDGLYIALNNTAIGSDQFYAPGTIYTCTSGFKVPLETGFDAASVLAGCGNKLKVNGALIADQGVEFWRRTNSLRDSRKTDASTIIGGTNAAAEEINFIPELLLSRPAFTEQSQRFDIDTFTGLPPIF